VAEGDLHPGDETEARRRVEAAGLPTDVFTPERLRRIWGADARLTAEHGRTGLHVAWLGQKP
jgi:hypothetical protein